jgi:predicted cupin superfamily sugar epimerase
VTSEADKIIRRLRLKPHPEGGHYRETFRDVAKRGRAHSTAIYFLLKRGEESRWHRIYAAEIWHFYAGAPLALSIRRNGRAVKRILGTELAKKQLPQIVVPAHAWQRARSLGDFTLVGCTVAPGFEFEKFEIADDIKLKKVGTRSRGVVKDVVRAKGGAEGNLRERAQKRHL